MTTKTHHATIARAAKIGIVHHTDADGNFASWEHEGLTMTGPDGKTALGMLTVAIALAAEYPRLSIVHGDEGYTLEYTDETDTFVACDLTGDEDLATVLDMAKAAADANEGWDIEAGVPSEEDEVTGSVVPNRYRSEYRARGDSMPDSCGDWLAERLEAFTKITTADSKKATFVPEHFVEICEANGIDTTKYKSFTNRTKGWEGRLRMSGRIVLEKVLMTKDELVIPASVHPDGEELAFPVPAEWRESRRKSK